MQSSQCDVHLPQRGLNLPAGFWEKLQAEPYGHDFFNVLRWIDARAGATEALGRAPSPRSEPIRVGQEPSMAFAPSMMARARAPHDGNAGEIYTFGFGLFGPNGPMPLHLSELVRGRVQHYGDRALAAFADIFHHRAALLFYRAWADAQATVSLDRSDNRFSRYVATLLHMGGRSMQQRDSVPEDAKYYMAGHLVRQSRNPEGLTSILCDFFGVLVRLRQYVPQWVRLDSSERLALGKPLGIGRDALLGVAVRDAQYKFRLEIGPLDLATYSDFLPGGWRAKMLLHWVRHYIGIEFSWDARLILRSDQATGMRLGFKAPLGHASWLGCRSAADGDAGDVIVNYEADA